MHSIQLHTCQISVNNHKQQVLCRSKARQGYSFPCPLAYACNTEFPESSSCQRALLTFMWTSQPSAHLFQCKLQARSLAFVHVCHGQIPSVLSFNKCPLGQPSDLEMHITVSESSLWVTDLEKRTSLNLEASSGRSEQEIMGPKHLEYSLEMAVSVPVVNILCLQWNSYSEGRGLAIGGTEHGFVKHKIMLLFNYTTQPINTYSAGITV